MQPPTKPPSVYGFARITAAALLAVCLSVVPAAAQAGEAEPHHAHHGHDGGSLEIGLSNSFVYDLGEGEGAYGVHMHSTYIFDESPFALGLGYEVIFGHHLHQSLGLVGCYRPLDSMALCVIPGVVLPTDEEDALDFVIHVEATYEMSLRGVHIGPTIGFAQDSEDSHLSVGVHTGVEF